MPWFGLSRRDDDDDDDEDSSSSSNSHADDDYHDENNDDSNSTSSDDDYETIEEGGRPMIIPSLNSSRSSSGASDEGDNPQQDQLVPQLSFRPLQPCDRQRIQQLHEQWFPVTYSNEFYNDLVNHHRLATSGDHLFTCVATVPNTPSNQQKRRSIHNKKNARPMQIHMYCQETSSSHDDDCEDEDEENIAATASSTTASSTTTQQQPPPTILQQQQAQAQQQQSSLPSHNDYTTQDDNDSHEIIVGCVVGAFLHPSRLNTATQQLLVPSPNVHSKLFYIMTLGTVEEYRGYGVATALVQNCMRLAQEDSTCGALYLHVIPLNTAAIAFYEKLGFYRVCAIENYYNIDNQHYDCYLYAKYYNGNRGHRTLYKLVSGAISSLWHHLKSPFSIFSYSHHHRHRHHHH